MEQQKEIEEFKNQARVAFKEIINRYQFNEVKSEISQSNNCFSIMLSNPFVILLIEGRNWGASTFVFISRNDKQDSAYYDLSHYFTYKGFLSLLPKGQIPQLYKAAEVLSLIGEEIFEGDFTFFNKMEALQKELEQEEQVLNRINHETKIALGFKPFETITGSVVYQSPDATANPEKALEIDNTIPIYLDDDEIIPDSSDINPVILRWFKEVGEEVATGDLLLEVETDKASMDIPAKKSGMLVSKLLEGSLVGSKTIVGVIKYQTR